MVMIVTPGGPGAQVLFEGYGVDAKAKGAGGSCGFDYISGFSSHQGFADRGVQRDLSVFQVHLVGAYDGVAHLGVGGEVGEFNLAEKGYLVFGEVPGVDYPGVLQNVLQEFDPADAFSLCPSGCAVFEVLAEVALSPRFGEFVFDLRVLDIDQVLELRCYFVVTFLGKVFHGVFLCRCKIRYCSLISNGDIF